MTFVVTLIALLIERFFDWSHLRRWYWYANYQGAVMRRFPRQSSYTILALTTIPLLIAVAVIQVILKNPMYGFLELLLDRKSTRLNSSHVSISYAVFCL